MVTWLCGFLKSDDSQYEPATRKDNAHEPEVMGQTVTVWVVETPLTLLAFRPTRFHTSILHPLTSHSVCLCLHWAFLSVCVYDCNVQTKVKGKKITQATFMFSCVICLCIYALTHPTVVYCRLCCLGREVLLASIQHLCSFILPDVIFPIVGDS